MKQRISHFITKNIGITEKTRPIPSKITVEKTKKSVPKTVRSRSRLAEKLGLKQIHCTYKVPKKSNRKTIKRDIQPTVPKIVKEIQLTTVEAKYASTPVVKKSRFLEELIKLEASVFRSLSDNGNCEVEIGVPGGRGQDQTSLEGFWNP